MRNFARLLASFALACCTSLLAAPPPDTWQYDTWQYKVSIYAFLPDIGGTTSFPQRSGSNVTVDAAKIVDNLKFTFMGNLEATNGRWGAFTDVVYMNLGNMKSQTNDFTLGGTQIPASATANLDYSLKGWAWTLAGTWRVATSAASTVDVLGGARLFDMEQTLGWEVTGNLGTVPVADRNGQSTAKISNWDAIVGAKGRFTLDDAKRWFVPWYVDVGTGESSLTWQAMGGVGYAFSWGEVVAAWRYLDYDMKSGKKIESMSFNGPAIAAVFHW